MTLDDWLKILDEADCLPDSERPWKALPSCRDELWTAFRWWLRDEHCRPDMVQLADFVERGLAPLVVPGGYFRFSCSGVDWCEPHGMVIPRWIDTGNEYARTSFATAGERLAVWRWLFQAVEKNGLYPIYSLRASERSQ